MTSLVDLSQLFFTFKRQKHNQHLEIHFNILAETHEESSFVYYVRMLPSVMELALKCKDAHVNWYRVTNRSIENSRFWHMLGPEPQQWNCPVISL